MDRQGRIGYREAVRPATAQTACHTPTAHPSMTGVAHPERRAAGRPSWATIPIFSNNEIDHFGDDGMDYGASNLVITHNYIHDNLDIGDGNHEDCDAGISRTRPLLQRRSLQRLLEHR